MSHTVVDILKVGLSGLVFLLCGMAYQLLRSEQRKSQPDTQMLKMINRYMWQSILCAMLVGAFAFADSLLAHHNSTNQALVDACGESLNRLDTFSKMPNITDGDLRHVASRHIEACQPLLDELKAH
jgi:hypothetical protein